MEMSDTPSPCLDAVPCPASTRLPPLDTLALPLPAAPIPLHITSLSECARYTVESLTQRQPEELTVDDEDALDEGFFLCDLNTVYEKLVIWRHLFPDIKPFYALKCHPDPMIAAVLGQSNAAGFDCASLAEIQLAMAHTSDNKNTRQIIYANPQRAEDALEQALQLGVRVLTFDGAEELHKVHRIYHQQNRDDEKQSEPQMVLRILVPDEHSSIPLGEKFGAPPDQWVSLIQLAVDLGLVVVGVSFHCGSGNHDPASYVQAIRLAKEAIDTITNVQPSNRPKPFILDIGGGYPGIDGCGGDGKRFCHRDSTDPVHESFPDQIGEHDSTALIAQAVTPLLRDVFQHDKTVQFVAEPGRYFVEAAFALCSRIYKVLRSDGKDGKPHFHYFISHGVKGVFKDTVLCGETFTPKALCVESTRDESSCDKSTELFASTVHGPSGEDYDLVCPNIHLPKLEVSDWLLFDRMGAYTMSIASRSGQPPVRYVC